MPIPTSPLGKILNLEVKGTSSPTGVICGPAERYSKSPPTTNAPREKSPLSAVDRNLPKSAPEDLTAYPINEAELEYIDPKLFT